MHARTTVMTTRHRMSTTMNEPRDDDISAIITSDAKTAKLQTFSGSKAKNKPRKRLSTFEGGNISSQKDMMTLMTCARSIMSHYRSL